MALERLDLNDLLAFVRVVDAAGYAAAARKAGLPKSSLSRRIARLEEALGLRLLHRTSRTFTLTDAGRALHEQAAQSFSLLAEATESATGLAEEPRGVIRLGAPPGVGVDLLPALLAGFLARYPRISVSLELALPTVDLIDAGLDLAIVPGPLRDSSLACRRLQEMAFKLYASPAYLQRAPALRTPEDLSRHACVLLATKRVQTRWRLHGADGVVDVEVNGVLLSDDIGFVRRAVTEGAGVGLLPRIVGDRLAEAGLLTGVLPGYESPQHPLLLVYPKSFPLAVRVKLLRDHLLANFASSLRTASLDEALGGRQPDVSAARSLDGRVGRTRGTRVRAGRAP